MFVIGLALASPTPELPRVIVPPVLGAPLLGFASAHGGSFAVVTPGYVLRFPADEGSHPAYRTEWWYVTGWLRDDSGAEGGFQVTFFRSRIAAADDNPSAFAPRQLLFAHAGLSDPVVGHLLHDERAAREGFGLAQAEAGAVRVWIGDWSLRADGDGYRADHKWVCKRSTE